MEEHEYYTRFGKQTAKESATNMLKRSWERLEFLKDVFSGYDEGDGIMLKGYAPVGLAAILDDIASDIYAAQCYVDGSEPEPGKIDDVLGRE